MQKKNLTENPSHRRLREFVYYVNVTAAGPMKDFRKILENLISVHHRDLSQYIDQISSDQIRSPSQIFFMAMSVECFSSDRLMSVDVEWSPSVGASDC